MSEARGLGFSRPRFGAAAWVWAIVLGGVLALGARARAEDKASAAQETGNALQAARTHFQKGVEYYGEGDFRAALLEFERAYVLQPTYRLLYNLGQVTYELRDYAAAERHFKTYLTDGGSEISPERREEVEQELKKLRSRVATLEINVDLSDARLFVDDRKVGSSPLGRPLRVSAGPHRVLAEHTGYPAVSKQVDVLGGDRLTIDLKFGPSLVANAAPASAQESSEPRPTNWVLPAGIATGVFAIGAAGMSFWAAADASDYDDELNRPTTRTRLDSLSDRTKLKALVADVLLGAAVVSGAITLILLLNRQPSEHASRRGARALQLRAPEGGLSIDAQRLQMRF